MTSVINEHSHGLAPVQMRSERKRSTNIDDFAPIAKTEEQWRYLDAERLLGLDAALLPAFTGKLAFSAPEGATQSVAGIDHKAFGSAGTPEDRVAAAAWGAGGQVQLISVPANFSSTEPVRLEITGESLIPSGLHIVIEAGAFAEATIVVDHRGQAALAENIEIIAGDESKLKIVSVQDWTRDSAHVSAQYIKLGRNAQLEHVVVTLGGDTVRVTPTVAYSAPGGDVNLLGAYFATAGQHFEHRPFVDHSQPNCKSNVTYKGALQGEKAHTVWVGDVLILSLIHI